MYSENIMFTQHVGFGGFQKRQGFQDLQNFASGCSWKAAFTIVLNLPDAIFYLLK